MDLDDDVKGAATARALETPVTLAIEGEICDATLRDVRDGLQQARDAKQTRLVLEIASDGGSVYACLGIIDVLREWLDEDASRELVTFATHAFSAACVLFGVGTTRVASPLSTFMNHACSGGLEGEVNRMAQQLQEAERVNALCDAQLAASIGENATRLLCESGEKYVDAATALDIGLATHVGHVRARVDVVVQVAEAVRAGAPSSRKRRRAAHGARAAP